MAFGMGGLKQLNVGMGLDPAPMQQGLAQAARMLRGWEAQQVSGMRRVGSAISAVGVAATGAAAAIATGFGFAIQKAIALDEKMGQIKALTEATGADIAMWEKGMEGVAMRTATGPQEIAEGLYFVASAGGDAADALNTVEMAAMGARMGMGEVSDISRALVAMTATYGEEGVDAAKAMDLLTQAVKVGAAEANEYAAALGRVLPIAQMAGQDLEEVFAAISTYTVTGASGAEAITAVSGLLRDLSAPSRTAIKAFDMLKSKGIDIQKTLGEQGLAAALRQLQAAVGDSPQAWRILLPNIEGMQAALALTGGLVDNYEANLKRMYDANGVTAKSFEKMKETVSFQMGQIKSQLDFSLTKLGQAALPEFRQFIPDLEDMARAVINLLAAFNDLSPAVKKWSLVLMASAGPAMMLYRQFSPIILGIGAAFVTAGKMIVGAMVTGEASVAGFKLATESLTRAEMFSAMTTKAKAFFTYAGHGFGGIIDALKRMKTAIMGISFANMGQSAMGALTGIISGAKAAAIAVGSIAIAAAAVWAAWKIGGEIGKWLYDSWEPFKWLIDKIVEGINFVKGVDLKGLERGTVDEMSPTAAYMMRKGETQAEWQARLAEEREKNKKMAETSAAAAGVGQAIAGMGNAAEAAGGKVELTRDIVTGFGRDLKQAQKDVEAYQQELKELSGVAAQEELAKIAQQVADIGGASEVADIEELGQRISDLGEKAGGVPPELQGIVDSFEEMKALEDATAKVEEFGRAMLERVQEARALFGPTIDDLRDKFAQWQLGLQAFGGELANLTDIQLQRYIAGLEELAAADPTGEMVEMWEALGHATTEATKRASDGIDAANKKTRDWGTAIQGLTQGIALLASVVGGRFGNMLQAMGNIGDEMRSVDWGARGPEGQWLTGSKFNAMAGAAGQIGGAVGGTAGATIQGAAGGAMMGFSVGGPIGAGIGAVVGGVAGFLGSKKKQKEQERQEAEANKQAIENMTSALEEQYGSIINARNAARQYGIDLQAALDTDNAEQLEDALKDLEKRQKGMRTAMQGAAGLADYKTGTPEAAMAQGALFGSVFWAAVKTEGLMAAADALSQPFKKLWENASEEMQALLAPVKQQLDLAANETFASAAQGASDLAKIISGLADAQMVSTQDLANASTLAMDQYSQAFSAALEQGLDEVAAQEAAIRAVGPALGALVAEYSRLGIPLDENLTTLKGIAETQGMIFPEDAMVAAAQAMERVAVALEKAFGLSTGIAQNFDRISNTRIPEIPTGGPSGGYYPGQEDKYTAQGGFGPRVLKKDTTIRAHRGETASVLTARDTRSLAFRRPAPTPLPSSGPAFMGFQGATINVTSDPLASAERREEIDRHIAETIRREIELNTTLADDLSRALGDRN